jgi:uncharacterized membrane protein
MAQLSRLLRHLRGGTQQVRRCFPQTAMEAIAEAVRECESLHGGEIRFAVEGALHPSAVLHGLTPRQRALEIFARLHVWDTEHNNGVLIYVLLADRVVEIVADRGAAGGRVPQVEWQSVCNRMEDHFREGRFEQGAIQGVYGVADVLAKYPAGPPNARNELPDFPVIIS